jgi:hypothetical protein
MSEPKEPRDFGLSGGDIGVIAIALIFTLCAVYLFIGPSPFASLYAEHPKPVPTEVSVGLPPKP